MSLRVIEGGPLKEEPPFYVSELHEENGTGWQVCWRTGEVARVSDGAGGTRGCVVGRIVGYPVDDQAAAEAFCAAMNARWAREDAEDAAS
ncbi:MAG: hypothetical protein ACYDD1_12440 [Caulobacteraceae bacterium]